MIDKRWFRLIPFLIIIELFCFINYHTDPANIFHDESREVANEIINGHVVYASENNGNEREIKRWIIEYMPEDTDCVVLGTSPSMQISREIVGDENLYNLGVSRADYYDILAQAALIEQRNINLKKIILCIDPYLFAKELYESHESSIPYRLFSKSMIDYLNGGTFGNARYSRIGQLEIMISQLFSVSYFQSCLIKIHDNKSFETKKTWGNVYKGYDGPYYDTDAHLIYAKSYQDKETEDVIKSANSYSLENNFGKGCRINETSAHTLNKLITYWQDKQIDVIFFLPPMSPTLWNRYIENKEEYPIITDIQKYVNDMKNRVIVTGSFNPYEIGIKDEEFYDARHQRYETYSSYYSFTD